MTPRSETPAKAARPRKRTGSREAVIKRVWRTAERQVRDIENRLVQVGQEPAERERDARIMAVLVKTLAELSALEEGGTKKSGARGATRSSPEPEHHDNANDESRSLDEFRRELARRIAVLAADEAAEADNGSAGERG